MSLSTNTKPEPIIFINDMFFFSVLYSPSIQNWSVEQEMFDN